MQQPQVEALEKAGGLILDQLAAAYVITPKQQSALLHEQESIVQTTGEKPPIGALLEAHGISTPELTQPLLDLQASARALLYAHGHGETAARIAGAQGQIDLQNGVPDAPWTLADADSGNAAKEQTALLQTRLLQTKVLTTAASTLEANGIEIPETTIAALGAAQDAAREAFAVSIDALRQQGRNPAVLEAVLETLPEPAPALPQQDIHNGLADAIEVLHANSLLDEQQANTLLEQEATRSSTIETLHARRHTRQQETTAAQPPLGEHTAQLLQERNQPPQEGHSR